jgi:hypothetical protein
MFIQADRLSEVQDYHSLSRLVGSLVWNQEQVQYKGDDFEKVLINAMNAINYLQLGDLDNALVEARRLNEKLYKYKFEAKRDYEQHVFAKYISALIWESNHNYDDAYIAFEESYKLNPSLPFIHEDLIRAAKRAHRDEAYRKWKEEFTDVSEKPEWYDKNKGEIVLIYQSGWAPRKQPDPHAPRFPKLNPVYSETIRARLTVDNGSQTVTQKAYSLTDVAIRTLRDQYAAMFGKKLGALATKAIVADQIRQKDKLLGEVAWIAMNLADRADLRQWSTLPDSFNIARISVPEGKYRVSVQGLSGYDTPTGEAQNDIEVYVRSGHKSFITWRSIK